MSPAWRPSNSRQLAASADYVVQRIAEAEAVWLAGGDQGDYVDGKARPWKTACMPSWLAVG